MQVLEGGETVAERESGQQNTDKVHSGIEDERRKFRFVERATKWEENEELERGDQVEASHLVLSESVNCLFALLCSSGLPCFQINPLRLVGY